MFSKYLTAFEYGEEYKFLLKAKKGYDEFNFNSSNIYSCVNARAQLLSTQQLLSTHQPVYTADTVFTDNQLCFLKF